MSKAGSSSSPSARAQGRRSYWVRTTVSDSPESEKATSSAKTTAGKRFLDPYRLGPEQRTGILSRLQEAQIGDEESRRLFAAALEYDLAACDRLTAAAMEPPPSEQDAAQARQDASLQSLAQAAASLADELEGLDAQSALGLQQALESADCFGRGYGERYIESLCRELRRVAESGAAPASPTPPEAATPDVGEEARRFVQRVAAAFENCFERAPNAETGSPFPITLEAIVDATGIAVPTDEAALDRILDRD